METVWTDQYNIHSFDVDFTSKAKLCALCNYFQESAWRHASDSQLGYHDLIQQDQAWVLSRLKIHINQLPQWTDQIQLKTWAKGADRLFAYRDFEIQNGNKSQALVKGSSAWLIVDINSKRPRRMQPYANSMPLNREDALKEPLDKIPPLSRVEQQTEIIAQYSDLDVNHHVNNVKYVEWILNLFSLKFQRNHAIREFEINYQHEVSYHETVRMELGQVGPDHNYIIQGTSKLKEKPVFCAAIQWESIMDS